MAPGCRHGRTWFAGCARCETEIDACDPTTIDQMFDAYARLDALYAAQGRRPPRDSDVDRLAAAVRVYDSHKVVWYARHPNHAADLGGEG